MSETPYPQSAGAASNPAMAWAQVVGGALVFLGSFLPWLTFRDESVSGFTEGLRPWGVILLLLGILIALLGLATALKIQLPFSIPSGLPFIVTVVTLTIGFVKWVDMLNAEVGSTGVGIWFVFLGGIVALVTTVLSSRKA